MDSSKTLDYQPKLNIVNDTEDKAVQTFLEVIRKNLTVKVRQDGRNQTILKLFQEQFELTDPSGSRKISSKLLQQAMWFVLNRIKLLDFEIHGTNASTAAEELVTAGVTTVMRRGGWISAVMGKGGAMHKAIPFGDGFVMIGTDPESDNPIFFTPTSNSNNYFDSYATVLRGGGIGRDCKKWVTIFSMSKNEFIEQFPDFKDKVAYGRIPRDTSYWKETERDYHQTAQIQDDIIEVGYGYDISNMAFCVFAGKACTIIKKMQKDKYPFILYQGNPKNKNKKKKGKPYIPVLQFLCWPSMEGFYNYGIGGMLYDIAIIQRRLMNLAIGHIEENTYPFTLVNLPQGEAAKFFNKLELAGEMRAKGKKGMVALEYDPNSPGTSKVDAQALTTQNLINEWEIVFNRLDQEIKRMGINIDEIQDAQDPNQLATSILAERETSDAFVKQIQEWNGPTYDFALEVTMDFMRQFIDKDDETIIDIPEMLETDSGDKVPYSNFTLGQIAEALRQDHYYGRSNYRSGAITSHVVRFAEIGRMLPLTQPGSPAQMKLLQESAELNNMKFSEKDFQAPQPSPQGQGPNNPQANQGLSLPTPTETDRTSINPKDKSMATS